MTVPSVIPRKLGSLAFALLAGALLVSGLVSQVAAGQTRTNRSADRELQDSGWTFIRGPKCDGHSPETELADSWPSEGPPVLWVRELGQGYSSFVAAGSRVYTQMQALTGQYVVCLDADTGATIWQHRYDWPYEALSVYPGPRATPTLGNGRVYFAAPSGLIGCLNADDGTPVWSVNLTEKYDGKGTGFGYACSPTLVDGKVVQPVGGKGASMVALDADDGTVVWASGDEPASYVPAYPITFSGHAQVVGYFQNDLIGFDLKTGRQLWRWDLSRGYDEHSAWPIYSEPYLWLSGPFRSGSQLLELGRDAEGQMSVKTVWKSSVLSNDVCSSVLVDGFLYGFDIHDVQSKTQRPSRGRFCCAEFLTGKERWSVDSMKYRRKLSDAARMDEVGHATVRVADGKLILFNDTGELILARPNPERYEELARVQLLGGEIVWTVPMLHRGRLYVRNHSRAACVFLGKPELLNVQGPQPVLTAADIPQAQYSDLAAKVLRIEPEYAFDVPSMEWFREWYFISLFGLLGLSFLTTVLAWGLSRKRFHGIRLRWALWTQAFFLGAAGTTALSVWQNDFVFTWPVCLFAAFQVLVYELRFGKPTTEPTAPWWRSRLIALGFLAVCVAYFLVCRRLSLVFEWSFLTGFLLAAPFSIAAARCARKPDSPTWRRVPLEIAWTTAAFTGFYWSPVALLMSRY